MVETKNAERAERAERATEKTAEQAFQRAEETLGSVMDNGRRTFQTVLEYNRINMNTSYRLMRDMQQESLRFTDAWIDQVASFHKSTLRNLQDCSSRVQDHTEKVIQENQARMDETLEQGLELVTPSGRRAARR